MAVITTANRVGSGILFPIQVRMENLTNQYWVKCRVGIQLVQTGSPESVEEITGGPAYPPLLFVVLLRDVFEDGRMHRKHEYEQSACTEGRALCGRQVHARTGCVHARSDHAHGGNR